MPKRPAMLAFRTRWPRRRRRWRWAPWGAVLVLAGSALAVGAIGRSPPPNLYQRTLAVAGQYRCPVCAGESAAASDAPEAVQLRKQVLHWLAQGRSPSQIRSYLVADYGPSILEKPPASGLGMVVWVAPAVALLAGGAIVVLGFRRWRRPSAAGPSGEASTTKRRALPGGGNARARPPRRRAPLAQPAPQAVRWRWLHRDLGAVLSSRAVQRASLSAGVALIALAGALWLLDRSSSPGLLSQTVSAGMSGKIDDKLQQAANIAQKDPVGALKLYDQVLAGDPGQPVALTSEGWLYVRAGFVGKGMTLLTEAETADPSYDLPHLYRGLVLLGYLDQRGAAAAELRWYLGHGPSASLTGIAKSALAEATYRPGTGNRP
ncbi:MAG: cytochrome c-type biogenesis protein CcmH [Acidimicrobiales bacterium]